MSTGNPLTCYWDGCTAKSTGVCAVCSAHLCLPHALEHTRMAHDASTRQAHYAQWTRSESEKETPCTI